MIRSWKNQSKYVYWGNPLQTTKGIRYGRLRVANHKEWGNNMIMQGSVRAHVVLAVTLACGAAVLPAHAQYTEVQASSNVIGDVEFDWGRDGLYCPTCNFGAGNARFNWTDRANNLWLGNIDPVAGLFNPALGQSVNVDTTAFFWSDWGNGPEWAFYTPPNVTPTPPPVSQLVYTRYAAGQPATAAYAGAAFAQQTKTNNGGWQVGFLPGAIYTPSNGGAGNSSLPEASQCLTDPVALVVYKNLATPTQMFTEQVNNQVGTAPTLTPFGAIANGIGERFVPCSNSWVNPATGQSGAGNWLTFQGNAVYSNPNTPPTEIQQVFWYNVQTQTLKQLTGDPTTKQRASMWLSPEFTDAAGHPQWVLFALAAGTQLRIYLVTGFNSDGSPVLEEFNTILSPEAAEPFIFDPKPFVHCSGPVPAGAFTNCQTYIVYAVTSQSGSQQGISIGNGLAVANINPANQYNQLLVSGLNANGLPQFQRLDPKYYITSQNGPQVYYDKIQVLSKYTAYTNEGTYTINMGLGAPSGPCVGSSAEGGLLPHFPNCQIPSNWPVTQP
jgi:hypothetical protein